MSKKTMISESHNYGHHGVVSEIAMHHNGRHAIVRVKHGRRPRRQKPSKENGMIGGPFDERPESSLVIPKEHADQYHVGMRVGVHAAPVPTGVDADDGDGDDEESALEDYRETVHGIVHGKRKRS